MIIEDGVKRLSVLAGTVIARDNPSGTGATTAKFDDVAGDTTVIEPKVQPG